MASHLYEMATSLDLTPIKGLELLESDFNEIVGDIVEGMVNRVDFLVSEEFRKLEIKKVGYFALCRVALCSAV